MAFQSILSFDTFYTRENSLLAAVITRCFGKKVWYMKVQNAQWMLKRFKP